MRKLTKGVLGCLGEHRHLLWSADGHSYDEADLVGNFASSLRATPK